MPRNSTEDLPAGGGWDAEEGLGVEYDWGAEEDWDTEGDWDELEARLAGECCPQRRGRDLARYIIASVSSYSP